MARQDLLQRGMVMHEGENTVETPETKAALLQAAYFWYIPVLRGRFERQSEPVLSLPLPICNCQKNDQSHLGVQNLSFKNTVHFGNSLNYLIVLP